MKILLNKKLKNIQYFLIVQNLKKNRWKFYYPILFWKEKRRKKKSQENGSDAKSENADKETNENQELQELIGILEDQKMKEFIEGHETKEEDEKKKST